MRPKNLADLTALTGLANGITRNIVARTNLRGSVSLSARSPSPCYLAPIYSSDGVMVVIQRTGLPNGLSKGAKVPRFPGSGR